MKDCWYWKGLLICVHSRGENVYLLIFFRISLPSSSLLYYNLTKLIGIIHEWVDFHSWTLDIGKIVYINLLLTLCTSFFLFPSFLCRIINCRIRIFLSQIGSKRGGGSLVSFRMARSKLEGRNARHVISYLRSRIIFLTNILYII